MASRAICCVALFVAFAALFQQGSALRCYVCSSKQDAICAELSNRTEHHQAFHTRVCDEMSYGARKSVCRKLVQKVHGEREVIRSCIIPQDDVTDGPCSPMTVQSHVVIESCHVCNTDLCNSATSIDSAKILYALVLAVAVYGSKRVVD